MNWIAKAEEVFKINRPIHFTDYLHCEECREHDETLRNASLSSIGISELGNPGWDPLCFCTEDGIKYYFPALIRITLETIENDFYFEQLLFHLGYEKKDNRFKKSCSKEQLEYISSFLDHMINSYPIEIENNLSTDEALEVHQLWHGK